MVVLAGFEIYVLQSAGGKPFQGSVKEGGADASSTYGRIDQDIAEYPEMLTAVLGVFKDTEAGESSIRLDGLENRHILGIDMLHNICMPERTTVRHHGRDIFFTIKCQFAYAHLYLAVGDVAAVSLKIGIEHLHQGTGIVRLGWDYVYFVIFHCYFGYINAWQEISPLASLCRNDKKVGFSRNDRNMLKDIS